jgi:5-methylcytosine-specific restriction endonuclease McrA
MKICETDYSENFAAAVEHLLAADHGAAIACIKRVPGSITFTGLKASSPDPFTQVKVFVRDRFQCRYCSRKTIFLPVLRILNRKFPQDFPWHPHSKLTECHLSFWRDFASCDHRVPLARGGTSDIHNLVTACYMCNSIKQNWLLQELRWDLLPASSSLWDGLTSAYPKLVDLLGDTDATYHRKWILALNALHEVAVTTGMSAGLQP